MKKRATRKNRSHRGGGNNNNSKKNTNNSNNNNNAESRLPASARAMRISQQNLNSIRRQLFGNDEEVQQVNRISALLAALEQASKENNANGSQGVHPPQVTILPVKEIDDEPETFIDRLHHSIEYGMEEHVKDTVKKANKLQNNNNTNIKYKFIEFPLETDGTTLLMTASRDGTLDLVKWLLDHGANIFSINQLYQNVLCFAIENKLPDIAHANTNNHKQELETITLAKVQLLFDTLMNKFNVRKKFSENNANRLEYFVNNSGDTWASNYNPLNFAIYKGYVSVVKYLLEKGADPLQPLDQGNTAFHNLCDYNIDEGDQVKIMMLLVDHLIGKVRKEVEHAPKEHLQRAVKTLVSIYLNTENYDSETPFFIACRSDNPSLVELLVQFPVNCLAINTSGELSIFDTCKSNTPEALEIVKLLLCTFYLQRRTPREFANLQTFDRLSQEEKEELKAITLSYVSKTPVHGEDSKVSEDAEYDNAIVIAKRESPLIYTFFKEFFGLP